MGEKEMEFRIGWLRVVKFFRPARAEAVGPKNGQTFLTRHYFHLRQVQVGSVVRAESGTRELSCTGPGRRSALPSGSASAE